MPTSTSKSRTARPAPAASRAGYRLRGLQGRVITQIGEAIVGGHFQPGQLLPRESELMAEFQASRTSLREALKVLAAKGLIETRQRIGTRVRSPDLWNVFDSNLIAWHQSQGKGQRLFQDLLELRLMVEPSAARLAASRATFEDLKRIEAAHAAMAASVDDRSGYLDADVEFHMAIFDAAHNSMLTGFAHIVGDFLRMSFDIQQQALNDRDNRAEDDAAGHLAVFAAINLGDGNAAADAMQRVILHGKRSYIAATT